MKRIFVFIIAMLISVASAFGQVYEYECNTPAPEEEKAFLSAKEEEKILPLCADGKKFVSLHFDMAVCSWF